MKRLTAISFLLMVFFAVQAQMQDPVKFKSELKTGSGPEAEMIFSATIDPGWHVYSTNLGQDGPIEASLHVNKKDGVELVGKLTPKGKEISQYDEMFGMKLRYFENAVQFVQKVKFTKPQYDIDAYLEWGACNDEMCMPPGEVVLKKSGKSPAVETSPNPSEGGENVPAEASAEEAEKADAEDAAAVQADSAAVDTLNAQPSELNTEGLWRPVIQELRAMGSGDSIANRSLWYILLMGFIGGLLAVAMPCIWPIIPMTVSFFLKRAKTDKKKGLHMACRSS